MRSKVVLGAGLWAVWVAGCAQVISARTAAGSDSDSDAGAMTARDAGASEGSAADAWWPTGASEGAPAACAPCVYDFECGPGGACMVTDPLHAPGVRGCAPACSVRDAVCSAGEITGNCVDGPGGTLVCVAANGCAGSARGAACGPERACSGRYGICAATGDASSPRCLAACTRDADCETGFSRCAEATQADGTAVRVCIPDGVASTACDPNAVSSETALGRALDTAGLSACALRFDAADLAMLPPELATNRYRLPAFDRVQRDWLAGVGFARSTGGALDSRGNSLAGMIAAAAGLRDAGDAAAVASGAAVQVDDGTLADEVARLIESRGGRADRDALALAAQSVPADLQHAVANVVRAIALAARARDAGLLGARTEADVRALYVAAPHMLLGAYAPSLSPDRRLDLGAMLGDVVLPVEAASALAATVEAQPWSRFRGLAGVHFRAHTPLGEIAVGGAGDDSYSAAEFPESALIIDLGGNDTYLAPVGANASPDNAVSVLIDLAGNDAYGYEEQRDARDTGGLLASDGAGRYTGDGGAFSLSDTNRQGAGRLGIGLLFDLGGDDVYRSLRGSQGFGALGIGALADDGGNDSYELEAGGQGAGMFGIGVLLDAGGNDSYTTWYASQGFGWVRGAGVLYDADGSDRFTARATPVVYPSAQDPRVNASVSQGFGFGRNGQAYADGVDMFGGVGVLRDRRGADEYACGVFGQGAAYLGGIGMLLEGGGDDRYEGEWYVQGAAAHQGFGALVDSGGRDVHHAAQNAAGGAAHDFALALLLADGDDRDEYDMPNLSLGAGSANGAGFFADAGGNDVYRADSPLSCGNAAVDDADSARRSRATVGVFLDGRGEDRYERRGAAGGAGNDARWVQRIDPSIATEAGAGCDAEGIALGL